VACKPLHGHDGVARVAYQFGSQCGIHRDSTVPRLVHTGSSQPDGLALYSAQPCGWLLPVWTNLGTVLSRWIPNFDPK
jgi:hypothetical protein